MAEYGVEGPPGVDSEQEQKAAPDAAPKPWYRSRALLGLWVLMVALFATLIVYGIVELSRGGGTSVPEPHTSTTTPTGSSTTSSSATTTTTSSEAPPPETPEQTPEEAPPPPGNNSPAPAEPPQHRHHLHIPSTITLPHTVITVPHGF